MTPGIIRRNGFHNIYVPVDKVKLEFLQQPAVSKHIISPSKYRSSFSLSASHCKCGASHFPPFCIPCISRPHFSSIPSTGVVLLAADDWPLPPSRATAVVTPSPGPGVTEPLVPQAGPGDDSPWGRVNDRVTAARPGRCPEAECHGARVSHGGGPGAIRSRRADDAVTRDSRRHDPARGPPGDGSPALDRITPRLRPARRLSGRSLEFPAGPAGYPAPGLGRRVVPMTEIGPGTGYHGGPSESAAHRPGCHVTVLATIQD
eukprot:698617-Hanusia_phi.AAC.1